MFKSSDRPYLKVLPVISSIPVSFFHRILSLAFIYDRKDIVEYIPVDRK